MRRAIQTVKQTAGKWSTVRYGFCEHHQDRFGKPQRSTDFQGPTAEGWEFRCRETSSHTSHRFINQPPHNMPKTPAEAQLWFQTEIAKQVVKPTRSQS